MGRCFTEPPVSTADLGQKMRKQGLSYSASGSLERGMKEMNTAANHSSQFTGSFSKPGLGFSALWRRGRQPVSQQHSYSTEMLSFTR